MRKLLALSLVAASLVAACGALPRQGQEGGRGARAAKAQLSPEAESALKLWHEAHHQLRPAHSPPDPAHFEALRSILVAESLDEAALRAALAALPAPPQPPSQEALRAAHEAARAAMSAEQREALALLFERGLLGMGPAGHHRGPGGHHQGPGGHHDRGAGRPHGGHQGGMQGGHHGGILGGPRGEGMASGPWAARPDGLASGPWAKGAEALGLSEAQKTLWQAFQEALHPVPPSGDRPDPAAHGQALAAFLRTGEAPSLPALPPAPKAFPTEAFVALAQALSPAQRQSLWEQHDGFGPGFFRGGGHRPRL